MYFALLFNVNSDELESEWPLPPARTPPSEITEDHKNAAKSKSLGNTAYKDKEYEKAIEHYTNAVTLDPTDVTFLGKIYICIYLRKISTIAPNFNYLFRYF